MIIETNYNNGKLEVILSGELDHHTAKAAMDGISAAIDLRLPRSCVLDFSNVSFMDSSGIAVIIRAKRRMDELEGELLVDNLKAQPIKVLNAAGINKMVSLKEYK